VGKTTVCTAVAQAWSGETWHLSAERISDPRSLRATLAEEMRIDKGDPATAMKARTGGLVVVDDATSPDVVAPFVDGLPCAVLLAAPGALGARAEQVFVVPPLPKTDAAVVFRRLSDSVRPGVILDDAVVARIVDQLDGVPLALELAAARLRLLSPAKLADRLEVPGRGVALALDASLALLTSAERSALFRLAHFCGPFSVEEAEILLELPNPIDPLDVVDGLVQAGLALPLGDGLRLVRPVRTAALRMAAKHGEAFQSAARAHAAVVGRERRWQTVALDRFGDVLVALRTGDGAAAADAAQFVAATGLRRGRLTEAQHALGRCLERHDLDDLSRARVQLAAAGLAIEHGRLDEASALLDACSAVLTDGASALDVGFFTACLHLATGGLAQAAQGFGAVAEACTDRPLFALRATINGGVALSRHGLLTDAQLAYDHALAMATELGDERRMAVVLCHRGIVDARLGFFERSEEGLRSALELYGEEHPGLAAIAQLNLGSMLRRTGQQEAAKPLLEQAVAALERTGHWVYSGAALHEVGLLATGAKTLGAGRDLFHRALLRLPREGSLRVMVLADLAETLWLLGDRDVAMRMGQQAMELASSEGVWPQARASALATTGLLERQDGPLARAVQAAEQAGDRLSTAQVLAKRAWVAAQTGDKAAPLHLDQARNVLDGLTLGAAAPALVALAWAEAALQA
jgi:tetratricopeptide (TPR) repeat protein